MSYEVQLAIYDLSHGMARELSAQFLGPQHQIDIIPHTALLVYGEEYFFGGGIQHENPQVLRRTMGIQPVQILNLGKTSVSRQEFEQWCQSCTQTNRYTMASYDLLTRNCNNFSHDAALEGLKLSQGVPQWVLDIPQTFISSPMGQMVRPMLENMQVGMGGGAAAPFANGTTKSFQATKAPPPPTEVNNPWANLNKEEGEKPSAPKGCTPTLDSFSRPLISQHLLLVCVKKVSACLEDDSDKETVETLGQILIDEQPLTSEQVEQIASIFFSKILQPAQSDVTFPLMMLRVIVLSSTGEEPSIQSCLSWVEDQLVNADSDGLLKSHGARSMAWLTLANAASLSWWKIPDSLVEEAFVDWTIETQPRSEVRQAAAAFCYNKVLLPAASQDEELCEDRVSLLCSSLESITEETDATTQLRRLLVAARILVPTEDRVVIAAKTLMLDLGFLDAVQIILQQDPTASTGCSQDAESCKALAGEVQMLLQA